MGDEGLMRNPISKAFFAASVAWKTRLRRLLLVSALTPDDAGYYAHGIKAITKQSWPTLFVSHTLCMHDLRGWRHFIVDTGAEVSVVSPKLEERQYPPPHFYLQPANRWKISTFGRGTHTLWWMWPQRVGREYPRVTSYCYNCMHACVPQMRF